MTSLDLGQAETEQLLGPHLPTLASCILSAFQDFDERYSGERHYLSPRSRASIVHDLMVKHAKERFDGVDGVRNFMHRGLFCLQFQDVVCLRFKKLDRHKRARNVPTRQALWFAYQLSLPGFALPSARLTAGYVLNRLGTAVEGVFVTCPSGNGDGWFIELAQPVQPRIPEYLVAKAPAQPPIARRVRVKANVRRLERDETGSS